METVHSTITKKSQSKTGLKDTKTSTNEVLVVIPYFKGGAQGNELEYAILGWEKHFKHDFKLVVVGDWHPAIDNWDNAEFLKCPRVRYYGTYNYRLHIDMVHKFRKVRERYPEYDGFIYACDDMYAVKDFTLDGVKTLKVRRGDIEGSETTTNLWVKDNLKTKALLIKEGLPTFNWVCHLPVWYDWDKLLAIYDKYHCDTRSYVVEQLYFNTYYKDFNHVVIEEEDNNYQFKLWKSSDTIDDLRGGLLSKIWISNSVKGWRPELEELLKNHYSEV